MTFKLHGDELALSLAQPPVKTRATTKTTSRGTARSRGERSLPAANLQSIDSNKHRKHCKTQEYKKT